MSDNDLDTCDRCGIPAERIWVGHADKGFDGLCDACLDLYWKHWGSWPAEDKGEKP